MSNQLGSAGVKKMYKMLIVMEIYLWKQDRVDIKPLRPLIELPVLSCNPIREKYYNTMLRFRSIHCLHFMTKLQPARTHYYFFVNYYSLKTLKLPSSFRNQCTNIGCSLLQSYLPIRGNLWEDNHDPCFVSCSCVLLN